MQEKAPLWQRIAKSVLLTLLTALLLAAFYIAVIMGNPQEDADSAVAAKQDQPLLTAMGAPLLIRTADQLGLLLDAFPAPVLAAPANGALAFEQGLAEDVPFEGGLARRITLTCRTAEGLPVTIVSLYPARAIDLIEKADYHFSSTVGHPLAGLASVQMENDDTIRMHAQGPEAIYVVTLPKLTGMALRTLTSTLQLYQGD